MLADPFAWLEDPRAARPWVAAQHATARAALDALPFRAHIEDLVRTLDQVPRSAGPVARGPRLYWLETDGSTGRTVVMTGTVNVRGSRRAFFDPAPTSVAWFKVSPSGRWLVTGTVGTEGLVAHLVGRDGRDIACWETDRPPEWLGDSELIELRWSDAGWRVTLRPVDVTQGRDAGIGDAHDPGWRLPAIGDDGWPWLRASSDGRLVALHVDHGRARTDVYLLDRESSRWRTISGCDSACTTVKEVDDDSLVVTDQAGPVRVLSLARSGVTHLLGEFPDATVEGAGRTADAVVAITQRAGSSQLEVLTPAGQSPISCDEPCSMGDLACDRSSERAFLTVTSFASPSSVWSWALDEGLLPHDAPPRVWPTCAVSRHECRSSDGTRIPLMVVHDQATVIGPTTPTIVSAYGGFGIPTGAGYESTIAAWGSLGGVTVRASVRGGGERGPWWHRAAIGTGRQRSVDDLRSAVEWVIGQGISDPPHLGLRGASNGGLIVAALITQAPELCGAALCIVPLADMARFHRGGAGSFWLAEYGDHRNPEVAAFLAKFSPYERALEARPYPALLVMAAVDDELVPPWHAWKLTAAIQRSTTAASPVLLLTSGGHHWPDARAELRHQYVDGMTFLAWQLGIRPGVSPARVNAVQIGS